MSVNTLVASGEFDRSPEQEKWETEKKFVVNDPNYFDFLLQVCEPKVIDQIYLSHPSEDFNLRVRQITNSEGSVSYSATLKAEGRVVPNGLMRRETPTEISKEAYERYAATDAPRLRKVRVEPCEGVSIDWIEGYDTPIVEIEDIGINQEAQLFFQQYADVLSEKTGENSVDNEWIAHQMSTNEYEPPVQLTVEEMAKKVHGYHAYGVRPVVVSIDGRSGSGKTTVAKQLEGLLRNGDARLGATLLSTDDYHRGKAWLEAQNNGEPWVDWDASIVYDTAALAEDLASLRAGDYVPNRYFSFADQEPHVDGTIFPNDVIIVEGIHAGTKELEGIRHFHFGVKTPLATSIGRDLSRLRQNDRPNSSIGTPEQRLRYQLEYAEPAFQSIDRVDKDDLRRLRKLMGKKVLQVRDGKVVTRSKRSGRQTEESQG